MRQECRSSLCGEENVNGFEWFPVARVGTACMGAIRDLVVQ
jgi:hypothetical protein